VTDRNGSRPGLVATQAGDVELRIPKLREGLFSPAILEPRWRIDQALYAVVMEAYVNGVSTRSVDDLVHALGVESGISKSEVSRICAGLDEQVAGFRSRPLHATGFPGGGGGECAGRQLAGLWHRRHGADQESGHRRPTPHLSRHLVS
jgi:putative transposase